jgi:hypothetical protein
MEQAGRVNAAVNTQVTTSRFPSAALEAYYAREYRVNIEQVPHT